MADRYQSLGGDGYISPGRRSHQPSTDLIERPHSLRHRGQRALFLLLSLLVLVTAAVCGFLFFPRPLTCLRSATPPSIECFSTERNLTSWHFTHTVTLINPNYAPVTLSSALVFFTLVPPPHVNLSHPSPYRFPSALPPFCQRTVALGSVVTSPPSSFVSALSTVEVTLTGRFVHTSDGWWDEVRYCLVETCLTSPSYELDIDGLLRLSWLQVEGDLVLDTVRVRVKCDHSHLDEGEEEAHRRRRQETAGGGQEELRESSPLPRLIVTTG